MTIDADGFNEYSGSYHEALEKGLCFTGANRLFYAKARTQYLKNSIPKHESYKNYRILDFGCGDGATSSLLSEVFDADVIGIDSSTKSIAVANKKYSNDRIRFFHPDEHEKFGRFNLIYSNGVFHHIPVKQRNDVFAVSLDLLIEGGIYSVFENTPWNIGTRFIMNRIPFDVDAIPVPPWEIRQMMKNLKLRYLATKYLFLIPPFMGPLFALDKYLQWLPLGGQYLVLAQKTKLSLTAH